MSKWTIRWTLPPARWLPWELRAVAPPPGPLLTATCDACRTTCTIGGAPLADLLSATFQHCSQSERIPDEIQERIRSGR